MPDQEGRSAVVTGAATGIGRAVAVTLASAGWNVVGVDTDADRLAVTTASHPRLRPLLGDVRDECTLLGARDLAESVAPLWAWVNNAAVVEIVPLLAVTREHIQRMLEIDYVAYLAGIRLAADWFLQARRAGSIVNIGSVHGRLGFPLHALYDSVKGAIEALTRSVVAEIGDRGIRVNTVAPGAVMTEREMSARAMAPPAMEPIAPSMFSSPEEIAAVVAFLAGDASSAINGAVIPADKGLSAGFLPR